MARKIYNYICSVTKNELQNQSQQFLCQLQQSLVRSLKLTFCRAFGNLGLQNMEMNQEIKAKQQLAAPSQIGKINSVR